MEFKFKMPTLYQFSASLTDEISRIGKTKLAEGKSRVKRALTFGRGVKSPFLKLSP
jgi:hypothetical protein